MHSCEVGSEMLYKIISYIDLTSLNKDDNCHSIQQLCEKAANNSVAAVCIYPDFLSIAKEKLQGTSIKLASVCNFPEGEHTIQETLLEIQNAIRLGADEIDIVMPYKEYQAQNRIHVKKFLHACRKAASSITMKIIIESGILEKESFIHAACEDTLDAGADFIKTSTGKVSLGASLSAAKIILHHIKNSQKNTGLKISGGIHTVDQALDYIALAKECMGGEWLLPNTFRIGTSKLLDNILATVLKSQNDEI